MERECKKLEVGRDLHRAWNHNQKMNDTVCYYSGSTAYDFSHLKSRRTAPESRMIDYWNVENVERN
jgi:hypothetical protein